MMRTITIKTISSKNGKKRILRQKKLLAVAIHRKAKISEAWHMKDEMKAINKIHTCSKGIPTTTSIAPKGVDIATFEAKRAAMETAAEIVVKEALKKVIMTISKAMVVAAAKELEAKKEEKKADKVVYVEGYTTEHGWMCFNCMYSKEEELPFRVFGCYKSKDNEELNYFDVEDWKEMPAIVYDGEYVRVIKETGGEK